MRRQAVAKPVTDDKDIENVATIATGSEAMGRTIATCFKRVGSNGATMVEDGQVHSAIASPPPSTDADNSLDGACRPRGCRR